MNEQAMKNYQELIDKLSQDSEAIGLKNEIEELENRLANPDYYRTPNRADGTPAQTGDFGREFNNYSSHIISTIESIRNLLNRSIEELRLNNADSTLLEGLNNVVNDVNSNIEQARIAIGDKNVDEASRLITAANEVLESNSDLLNQNIISSDQEEYNRLMSDRSEEINDHMAFINRAESLQAKDENGNPYLDRNGRPVVNVNLYNMISDEKKLAKAKEAYANTSLGLLENMMSSMGVNDIDFASVNNEPVQPVPTPMDETDVANEMYDKLFGEDADIVTSTVNKPAENSEAPVEGASTVTNNVQEFIARYNQMMLNGECFVDETGTIVLGASLIKDGDSGIYTWNNNTGLSDHLTPLSSLTPIGKTASLFEFENLCSEETLDPEIKAALQAIIYDKKHDYYFEHPEYGKVIPVSDKVKEDGTVDVQTHRGEIISVKLSELLSSDVLVDKEVDKGINNGTVDTPQADPKAAERKANLKAILEKETMDGAALDGLEKNGVYMSSAIKPADKSDAEDVDDTIIKMPEKVEGEVVIPAAAANDVYATNTNDNSVIAEVKAEEIKGSEDDTMSKKTTKQNVTSYTDANDAQKKEAKGKLSKLKAALAGAGLAATLLAAGVVGYFAGKSAEEPTNDTTYETTIGKADLSYDRPDNTLDGDKTLDDERGSKGDYSSDNTADNTVKPDATAQTPVAPVAPVGPQVTSSTSTGSVPDSQLDAFGLPHGATDITISDPGGPSQESLNAAAAGIANGTYGVGSTIQFDNGAQVQVVSQSESVEHSGPGYTDPITVTYEEVGNNTVNPPVSEADVAQTTTITTQGEETATLKPGESFEFDDGTSYTNNSGVPEEVTVVEKDETLPEGLGTDFSVEDILGADAIQAYDSTYFGGEDAPEESNTHRM